MMKNERLPLITIGITCFNAADTIARAIDSALAQDWSNLEVLVVDDKSTDNSVQAVEKASAGNPKITIIQHQDNQGPAGARKTILERSRGEFITFFDDDDESLPERVRVQYERIISYENETGTHLIACYASGKRRYKNGYEMELNAIGSRPIIPQGSAIADYALFYGKKPGLFYGAGTPTNSLMARKSTFEAVGGFDPAFRRVEDVDFAIRLGLAGGHFIGCPEILFIQHATEAVDKAPGKNMEAEIQLAEKHKDYLQSVGRYEYARRWPLIRYYHFMGRHGKMLGVLMSLFLRHPVKVASHFLYTAPRRFLHERKMKRERHS
jgi:glycosyltransferase involved in cell wall biosynthesis